MRGVRVYHEVNRRNGKWEIIKRGREERARRNHKIYEKKLLTN